MCGTSHDGLDMADVSFMHRDGRWTFELHGAQTVPLADSLRQRLDRPFQMTALEFVTLDRDFAVFCADEVMAFMKKNGSLASFIASHGVTMFHDPARGITNQLGSGAILSSRTGLVVVSDFRLQDVSKGGQGAPLVPGADHYLFSDFQYTLNLGGFANLTDLGSGIPRGFDTGPCNLLLNKIIGELGLSFDLNGNHARQGRVVPELLDALNRPDYFSAPPPKSLGLEWLEDHVFPLLRSSQDTVQDKLRTSVEHIAMQIGHYLNDKNLRCLVTGGGAFNGFLLERLSACCASAIVKPSDELINFKEAIAFAFLGLLRLYEQPNAWASVTGASGNSCTGAVYLP